jgi:hypothetical protein
MRQQQGHKAMYHQQQQAMYQQQQQVMHQQQQAYAQTMTGGAMGLAGGSMLAMMGLVAVASMCNVMLCDGWCLIVFR